MIIPFQSVENKPKKWYKNPSFWILTIVLLLVIIIISFTIFLLFKKHRSNNPTHIHYTRINTNIYSDAYELYQLDVLPGRNPDQQYKLFGDFLRVSLFNRSNYEQFLPSCPIIYSMSSIDHPEDWRGMLFGTIKFPRNDMPHPYVCYLSVIEKDRRHKLGSVLLNQFINDIFKNTDPPATHIQLHANWENCRAQKLYKSCGFRCNEFTLDGYAKPFEPEYKFGHMIRMELNLANIKDRDHVCQNSSAVEISLIDEENYRKLCQKKIPKRLNSTC